MVGAIYLPFGLLGTPKHRYVHGFLCFLVDKRGSYVDENVREKEKRGVLNWESNVFLYSITIQGTSLVNLIILTRFTIFVK